MMRSAAIAIACKPEEQKRLIVMAETSTGNPARSEAMRATFMPCSASGIAHPRITSSISLGSRRGTRSRALLTATAASSSGRVARSVPLKARPTGVRTEEAITTSLMGISFLLAVSYQPSPKTFSPQRTQSNKKENRLPFWRIQQPPASLDAAIEEQIPTAEVIRNDDHKSPNDSTATIQSGNSKIRNSSISERIACLQRVLNSLLRLFLAAE